MNPIKVGKKVKVLTNLAGSAGPADGHLWNLLLLAVPVLGVVGLAVKEYVVARRRPVEPSESDDFARLAAPPAPPAGRGTTATPKPPSNATPPEESAVPQGSRLGE